MFTVVMPKKAAGGSGTADLLEYLFGPGERDEHTDPHLACPARDLDRVTLAEPALLLDAPVEALRAGRPSTCGLWRFVTTLTTPQCPTPAGRRLPPL
ncbi:hypothetical protein ACF09Z_00545 [Streptomyces erythrochromogenes]|uniref:hypothetical protein n=1 Tax=Streptomyces erythrochromogenes TaxID=285574 RepID=UPI00370111CA